MKKFCLMMGLFICIESNAQYPVKGERVKVLEWGSRSLYLLEGFFAETMDTILVQIGEQEFEQVKTKAALSGWPKGLYFSGLDDEEDKAFDKRLGTLKMYKIASYLHKFNGKTFERYVILRVPYEENSAWDPAVQWQDNIYFLLKENDVQVVK